MKLCTIISIALFFSFYLVHLSSAKQYASERSFQHDMSPDMITNGRNLYNSACSRCHGLD